MPYKETTERTEYISVAKAAQRLECHPRTVRRLIVRGLLKAKRTTPIPRSRYKDLVSSIEEFEKQNAV